MRDLAERHDARTGERGAQRLEVREVLVARVDRAQRHGVVAQPGDLGVVRRRSLGGATQPAWLPAVRWAARRTRPKARARREARLQRSVTGMAACYDDQPGAGLCTAARGRGRRTAIRDVEAKDQAGLGGARRHRRPGDRLPRRLRLPAAAGGLRDTGAPSTAGAERPAARATRAAHRPSRPARCASSRTTSTGTPRSHAGHLAEIARVIREQRPDVVALQEVHRGTWQARFRDQPAELARLTGM